MRQGAAPESLPRLLTSLAEDRLVRAVYFDDLGLKSRACNYYLEAALWGINAELITEDQKAKTKLFAAYRSAYALAAPYFSNPGRLVDIGYLSGNLKGYLRLPQAANENGDPEEQFMTRRQHPCVVIFNGLNSPKEELHYTENALLAAGLATLSFDYPAVQENKFLTALPFDVEELDKALYLFLLSRPEIDTARLALYGLSIGARFALHVGAESNERFKAIVSLSAPYEMLSDLDMFFSQARKGLAIPNSCSKTAVFDLAERTTLRGRLQLIEAPVLVAGGGRDQIAMPEETRTIYDQLTASDRKLIYSPAATHNCYEMMPSLRYEIAQWIKQRL
jgi:pimeloyl-ACP methyl ester carboxylesterase